MQVEGAENARGRARPRAGFLPHELIFGAFLLITWIRLVFASGVFRREALVYLAFIAVNVCLICWCRVRGTPLSWRLRLLFYPIAMNVTYSLMRPVVLLVHPQLEDAALQQIDRSLIGTNLSLRLEPWINPVLTELLSFGYLLFFPYLLFSIVSYFAGELPLLKKFFSGLFSLYGIGLLGYSLVPAQGPYLNMAEQFTTPLQGWWITHWNSEIVRLGSNGVDVFPSLHCAVSAYFLGFDWRHKRWRFKLYVVPCVALWISTIYLRYHYLIDILGGFALALFSLWIAFRYEGKERTHELRSRI